MDHGLNGREIISVADMRAIDAAAGLSGRALMDNAGRAVAAAAQSRFPAGEIVVLCGPGANGGDGYVAARVLSQNGRSVRVAALGGPRHSDAIDARNAWGGETSVLESVMPSDVYVDALFGAGLDRPLEGAAARAAEFLNANRTRVVAVDTPSGLPGDGGAPKGPVAAADVTVTFVRKKRAHVLETGRALCGAVIVADIGADEQAVAARDIRLWENGPAVWGAAFPWPGLGAHKHARGHAMIASGGLARSGAARLAAEATLRIGAGLVTLLAPTEALPEIAAQITSEMARACDTPEELRLAAAKADALLIGPGFGLEAAHRDKLAAVLAMSARPPLVLDADALTLIGAEPAALGADDVLTPHVGEFDRIAPGLLARGPTRIEAALEAARARGAVVLLKGPDTVVAAPDGRAVVNTSGTPFLATAGSGDVLAGMIAGLAAQGGCGFEAGAIAAWLHGRCGEVLGPGLVSSDLARCLPALLNDMAPNGLKRT